MVKIYTSLLALTLVTSSALAYPLTGTDVRQRDLDQEEFLGREYDLLDVRDTYHNDDLEGRSIFSVIGAFGKAGSRGAKLAEKANKLHDTAKHTHHDKNSIRHPHIYSKLHVDNKADKFRDMVNQFQVKNSNKRTEIFLKLKDTINSIGSRRGHHRRDLEEGEELLQRDFEDEQLLEREYDDFLVERDAFADDLD